MSTILIIIYRWSTISTTKSAWDHGHGQGTARIPRRCLPDVLLWAAGGPRGLRTEEVPRLDQGISGWCFGTCLGMSSSQLTVIFSRGLETTNQMWCKCHLFRDCLCPGCLNLLMILSTSQLWKCYFGPKLLKPSKTRWEKTVTSHYVLCPASQTLSVGRDLFFWVFSMLGDPGRNFHPDKDPLAQLSSLHMLDWCLQWCIDGVRNWWPVRPKPDHWDPGTQRLANAAPVSYWFWLLSHQRKLSKVISITHLFRHSFGLMLYSYAEVLVRHL